MTETPLRMQARITLPAPLRDAIDRVRERWNPEVARGNPAHVTIVYHDEAADPVLLRARLAEASRSAAPFSLVLGPPARFAAPGRGAYLQVADPGGEIERLRRAVLAPPFAPRTRFGLHVTLLHPLHGDRLDRAWPDFASLGVEGARFAVHRIDWIAGHGAATERLASIPLGGESGRD